MRGSNRWRSRIALSLIILSAAAVRPFPGGAADEAASGGQPVDLIRLTVRPGHVADLEHFLVRLADAARRTGAPVRWRVHRRVDADPPVYVLVLRAARAEQLEAWSGLTASATLERAYGTQEAARLLALRESALESLVRERFVGEPTLAFDD